MTKHVVRLYTLAASVFVLFLVWAVVAAHPWQSTTRQAVDPRVRALAVRERRVRAESLTVRRVVARRWHNYRVALTRRRRQIAAAKKAHQQALAAAAQAAAAPAPSAASPSVRVVTLPPLTVTRTS